VRGSSSSMPVTRPRQPSDPGPCSDRGCKREQCGDNDGDGSLHKKGDSTADQLGRVPRAGYEGFLGHGRQQGGRRATVAQHGKLVRIATTRSSVS
jgi:hypothetical protein